MTGTADANRLAIDGGGKVRCEPMPCRHLFGAEDKQAVITLFDQAMEQGSDVLGYGGPRELAYCQAFAESLGGGFADGVNSGTNAVFVALRALELEPFTEVIVPAVSDPGGVMPVVFCNCVPVPADSAPGSYNSGAEQIAARITERTSAIVVAHIAGIPADMDAIMELARARHLPVIEDCAQAHGARYKGRPVGSIGDMATFSTMFGKHHATAGQGGVVFTRSEQQYWKVRRHADRGKPIGIEGDVSGGNVVAGLNCNMDELHAAIGLVQLGKLPETVRKRRHLAGQLAEGCQSLRCVRMVGDPPGCEASFWFLFFRLDPDVIRIDRNAFVKALVAEGITSAGSSYLVVPTRMSWHRNHAAFGASCLPWSGADGSRGPLEYELPNIEAVDARSFVLGIHED